MTSFFLPQNERESKLYSDIRDNPKVADVKHQIEELWLNCCDHAPKGFRKKAQVEFYQRWWEMYLTVGLAVKLDALEIPIETSSRDKGPDIEIPLPNGPTIWIEAIAPNSGDTDEAVPELTFGEVSQVPRHEFLLRLTQALKTKQQKFTEYKSNKTVGNDDICIVAISACALNQWGSLMENIHPHPIMSIIAGFGCQIVTLTIDTEFSGVSPENEINVPTVQYQPEIYKESGNAINTAVFSNPTYQNIAGVLYSYADMLNASDKPEDTFQIFLNPNADNPLPIELFDNIKIWRIP